MAFRINFLQARSTSAWLLGLVSSLLVLSLVFMALNQRHQQARAQQLLDRSTEPTAAVLFPEPFHSPVQQFIQSNPANVAASPAAPMPGPSPTRPNSAWGVTSMQSGPVAQWAPPNYPGQPAYAPQPISTHRQEVMRLVGELKRVPEDQRDAEKISQLQEYLMGEFEDRHNGQLQRLDKLKQQTARTEETLTMRAAKKDEIVGRRMAELLGNKDPLNWDYGNASASPLGQLYFAPTPSSSSPGLPLTPSMDAAPAVTVPSAASAALPSLLPETANLPSSPPPRSIYGSLRSSDNLTTATAPPNSQFLDNSGREYLRQGMRVRQLTGEIGRLRALYEKKAVSSSTLKKAELELEAAQAEWQVATRELENELEILSVQRDGTRRTIEHYSQLSDASQSSDSLLQLSKSETELRVLELRLQAVAEKLDWISELKERLDSDESSPEEDQDADENVEATTPEFEDYSRARAETPSGQTVIAGINLDKADEGDDSDVAGLEEVIGNANLRTR